MSGTTATFTYNTGTSGTYDWSVGANWNIGTVSAGDAVVVNAGTPTTDITVDNITSLTIASLNLGGSRSTPSGTVEIAAGDTLIVTGAVSSYASGRGQIELLGNNTTLEIGVTQTVEPSITFDPSATGPEELILAGSLKQGDT
ncbi:MAG: hypothetical protein ACREFY_14020, partial [Acetobacteraceae bacterium]